MVIENSRIPASAAMSKSRLALVRPSTSSSTASSTVVSAAAAGAGATQPLKHSQTPHSQSQSRPAPLRRTSASNTIPAAADPLPSTHASPPPGSVVRRMGRASESTTSGIPTPRLARSRVMAESVAATATNSPSTPPHVPLASGNHQQTSVPVRRVGMGAATSRYVSPVRQAQPASQQQQMRQQHLHHHHQQQHHHHGHLPSPSPNRSVRNPSPSPQPPQHQQHCRLPSPSPKRTTTRNPSPSPQSLRPASVRLSYRAPTGSTALASSNLPSASDPRCVNTITYAHQRAAMNRSQQQQKQPQQKQQQQKQQKQQQQKQQQQHQKPVAGPLSGVSRLARGKASASSATQSKVDRLSAGGSAVGPNVRTSAALSKPSRPSDPHGRRLNTSNRPSSRPSDPSGFGGMPPARGSGKLKMSMLPRGTRDFGNKVSNSNKHGNEENGMGNPRKQSSRVSIRLTPGRAPPLIESPYARGGRQQSSIAAATHHPSPGLPSTPQRRLDLQPTEPRAPDRPLDYTFSQSDSYQEDPAMSTSFTSTVSNGGSSNSGIHGARGFPASVLANPAATAGDDRHLSTGSVERLSSTSTGSTRQRVSALESFRAARRASLQKAEKESNLSGRKVKDLSKSGQYMTSQNGSDCGTDLGDDDRPSCDTNNTENISDPDRFSEETEQDSYGIPLPPPPASDFAQRLEAAAHSPPNPTSQRWLGADQCVDSYTSNANQFNSSTVSPLQSSVGSGRLSNGFPDDQRDMLPDRPEVSIRSGMSMTNAIAVMGMLPDRHDTSLSADGGRMKRRKNSRFSDIEEEIDLGNVQKLRCSLRGRRSMADAHETPKLRRSSVGISVTGNIKVDNALDSLPHGQQQLGSSQLHQPYTGLDNRSSSISSRQPLRSIVSNASDTAEFDVDVDVSSPTTGSLRHSQRRSSAVVGDNDKSAAGSEDTARHITGGSDHSSYSTFSTAVFRSRFGHLTKLDEADFGLENEDDVEDLADSLHE